VFTGGVEDISRGRVELLINGEWHTVCSQGFGFKEANVICNQLGLNGARRVRTNYYGIGSGGIVALRNRGCDGGETNILDCDLQSVSANNTSCSHNKDVGIECLGTYVHIYLSIVLSHACHTWYFAEIKNETYRTVKNFGGQKVWRKGLLQGIGKKNFGEF